MGKGAPDGIWQQVLSQLKLQLTQATFNAWFPRTKAELLPDGALAVTVANTYAREWLEARLRPTIERTVARVSGRPLVEGAAGPMHRAYRSRDNT